MTDSIDRRVVLLRRMAWLCAALVLAITTLSAFLRLSKAGIGCEPWPQCHEQLAASSPEGPVPASGAVSVARLAHRVTASLTLILVLVMAMTALAARPVRWAAARLAVSLVVLAVFLAVLGRWSARASVPAVTLGNLLAGLLMFALSCQLAWSTYVVEEPGTSERPGLARWAAVAATLIALQSALGGLVSARHAGPSCPSLLSCQAQGSSARALDPWRDSASLTRADRALVQGVHRSGAVVLAFVVLPVGIVAWRRRERSGGALVALWLLQAAIGAGLVLGQLPLALALAHNVVAALLLAAALRLAVRTASR